MNGRPSALRSISVPIFSSTLRAFGPDDTDLGILLGHIGGIDLPVPPFRLQPFLHPGMNAISIRRMWCDTGRYPHRCGPQPRRRTKTRFPNTSVHSGTGPLSTWTSCWCKACPENLPASGPLTIILPRVEASSRPTELRTARISRFTASSVLSPAFLKQYGRRQSPTGSQKPPLASIHSCIGGPGVGV